MKNYSIQYSGFTLNYRGHRHFTFSKNSQLKGRSKSSSNNLTKNRFLRLKGLFTGGVPIPTYKKSWRLIYGVDSNKTYWKFKCLKL